MNITYRIHMIGTTHFDPVWFWTWDEATASIRSTFRSALDRINEEKDFIYSFSCPQVFEWIKNVDEGLFNEIRRRVEEGRWHLVEGWWVQPDCNNVSGESYVRQGLYGQRYLLQNFGKRANSAFNTDSVGHNAMLPQILKKSGIDYYVFSRPSFKDKELPGPLFCWESSDGSRVLAFGCSGEGVNQYSFTIDKDAYELSKQFEKHKHDMIMLYGVSNHGGAPTRKSIAQIKQLREENNKGYDVVFSTTDVFFAGQDEKLLPVVKDELNSKLFGIGGFSTHTEIKRNNRIAEYLLVNAEKVALLAKLTYGKYYPKE